MLENTGQKTDSKNTDNLETKAKPEKANNAKYTKIKIPWFSRLLRHSARKRGNNVFELPLKCLSHFTF